MIICALATFLLLLNEFFPIEYTFCNFLWFVCNIYVFLNLGMLINNRGEKVGIMLKSALMKILSIVSNIVTR